MKTLLFERKDLKDGKDRKGGERPVCPERGLPGGAASGPLAWGKSDEETGRRGARPPFFLRKMHRLLWLLVVMASATSALSQTNQPNPVEVKLRESLRAALVQARDAEAARARLQSEVEAKDATIKELTDQLAAAHKRADEDKLVAEQALALSNERFFREQKEAALLRESLAKWKASHAQAVALARAKEAERTKLEPQVIELTRRAEDRERKNLELYQLGSEILERYENFAFGRALTAREPFTGLAKVKLEELVQGYKDKLADAKLTPVEAPPPPPVKAKPKRAQPGLR